MRNRFFLILIIFGTTLLISCGNKTPAPKTYKEGLTIDSSIKEEVMKRHKAEETTVSELDVNIFENDKVNNKSLVAGKNVPHNSYTIYHKDTLTIVLTNFMASAFGVKIEKTKDTCVVIHGFSVRDVAGSFKLKLTDPSYESGLQVPCRYSLVLDKEEYDDGETIYGYIDCTSADYYEKGKEGDFKKRVSFKGYFKAGVFDKN